MPAHGTPDEQPLKSHATVGRQVIDIAPGTLICSRYEILENIGAGGWGTVFKAKDQALNRLAALKFLHAGLLIDPDRVERLRREAIAAGNLSHPNIAAVYDWSNAGDGQPFIVMELLDGVPLSAVLNAKGTLSVKNTLDIFAQLSDALALCHRRRIVHRDLKPSNIIMVKNRDGELVPKLVDFGIAKLAVARSVENDDLTEAGAQMGTVNYMSPEQCNGAPVDGRSDIYAIGCILYEVLSGKKAFSAPTALACMLKQIKELPPPLSAYEVDVPASLEHIVFQCLQKEPERRFSTMEELKAALLAVQTSGADSGVRKRPMAKSLRLGLALVRNYRVLGITTSLMIVGALVAIGPGKLLSIGTQHSLGTTAGARPSPQLTGELKTAVEQTLQEAARFADSGQYVQAEGRAQAAIVMLGDIRGTEEEARAHLIIGQNKLITNELHRAEDECRQAIAILTKLPNEQRLQSARQMLATILEQERKAGR